MKRVFKQVFSALLCVALMLNAAPLMYTGAYGKSKTYAAGDILNFGMYPQSRVTDENLINRLAKQPKTWKSYGYYTGSGVRNDGQMKPSDFMEYADFSYGTDVSRTKYRAVRFSAYRPIYPGYAPGAENSYQDNNGYALNTEYYFKFEPIRWRVLDPKDGFLMSVLLLDTQPYNNYMVSVNNNCYGNPELTCYANNYENSSIRAYLNKDFYNTAFTGVQKALIKTTTLDNSASSAAYNGAPTDDKVFLLNNEDVLNPAYGFDDNYKAYDAVRRTYGTDYAKSQGLFVYKRAGTDYHKQSWWWLRSTHKSYSSSHVYYYGSLHYVHNVDDSSHGIRPALKVSDLNAIENTAGLQSVKLKNKEVSIFYKEKTDVSAEITSDGKSKYTVRYESSDPKTVSVDRNGVVYGAGIGTAVITVTVTDEYGNKGSYSCEVTVEYAWYQLLILIFLFGWLWY